MREITNKALRFKLSPLACAMLVTGFSASGYAQEDAVDTDEAGIEVIQVTSTKRATSLMETGQAVSAFNADSMEDLGIDDAQGLVQYSPSLVITSNRVSIRGVGRPTTSLGSDPGVGIYTDGVYNTENGVFSYCNFCDVDRIEVLRGPQGTLYGRNAVGGAINFISTEPQKDFGGYINLEAGNDGYLLTQGQVTGGLGDIFSAIVTVSKKERDALQENIAEGVADLDDEDRTYFSATLKADWSENWTSSLRYMNTDRDENPSPGYLLDEYPTDYINIGPANLPGMYPNSVALNHLSGYTMANPAVDDENKINVDTVGHLSSETERFIFTNVITVGDIDVKYIYGDYTLDYDSLADGDVTNAAYGAMDFSMMFAETTGAFIPGGPFYLPNPITGEPITLASDMTTSIKQDVDTSSHELQFISNFDGNFNFIAGLYYYNSEESQYNDFVERGFGLMQGDAINAYYGSFPPEFGLPSDTGTFLGLPGVQLSLYQFNAALLGGAPFKATPEGDGGYLYSTQNELETTSKAVYGQIEYDMTNELTLTAGLRYSEDEKEGSDDVFTYLFVPQTQHKVKDDWSKVTWRLQADWQMNQDTLLYGYVATGYRSGGFNLGAAATDDPDLVDPEELTAFEVGYKKSMFDNRANLSLAAYYYDYTDLQVQSDKLESGVITSSFDNAAEASVLGLEAELQFLLTDDLVINTTYSYNESEYDDFTAIDSIACAFYGECEIQDLSGNQLNMAPENKFSIAGTQYFDLNDKGSIALTASYSYVGEQYSREFNRDDIDKVDSYDSIDARLSWTSPEEAFVIAAFVKNAGDERNVLRYSAPSTQTRMQAAELSDPITYGLQLRYSFY
ncbi:TonB-dependent receptor [Thalassotalea sp. Y01]|uniref:TonB-dependent receptor n=1 Tax=Thalassotalea sp. Y01 TaxID=2729613 RepID=UPI00145E54EB|nr:TonB-dependent receptor [Thalassotalea sp. Y01]NMP15480.1 TonB-dependent receptor [Thalassotalea sp. Y01]